MGKFGALADSAGDSVRQVIRAYHGSPYDFDRFDASKIGTGEGMQSFGHGLYFAGEEDVAKQYRDDLAGLSVHSADGSSIELPTWISKRMIEEDGPAVWRNRLLKIASEGKGDVSDVQSYAKAMEALEGGGSLKESGRMYEVEIGHPEEALLDWDAPLGGQPKALRRLLGPGRYFGMTGAPGDGERLWYNLRYSMTPSGAAEELASRGVPGIRYLDRNSRASGQGTHNYVMFPGSEDAIRILRKYAVPGAVGTGVASQYEESP